MGEGSFSDPNEGTFSQTHCSEDSASSNLSSSSKQMPMESFIISTTSAEKKLFDKSIAKHFYGSNIPFRAADSKEFKYMVNNLRPGYKPPNSKTIGGFLLDEVYNELKCGAKDILNGCMVSLCVDGWSNVSSDSVVGMSVFLTTWYPNSKSCILEYIGGENEKLKREFDAAPDCEVCKFLKSQVILGNLS